MEDIQNAKQLDNSKNKKNGFDATKNSSNG